MKREILLCLALGCGLLGQSAEAEEGKDPFSAPDVSSVLLIQVLTSLEFIELPQVEATRLLYQERLGKDGDKLRKELQKLLDEGKAVMAETTLVAGRSGQRSTVESIREMIYPTESDGPDGPPGPLPARRWQQLAIPVLVPPWVGILPTVFETRNTGGTLEVEPTVSKDLRTIHLRIVHEVVFFTGLKNHRLSKDPLGNEYTTSTPIFYSMRTNTALTVQDGESRLVAVLSPKGKEGPPDPTRKMLVIARCDISPLKKSK